MIDAETLYHKMRALCEEAGAFITDEADDMLSQAAEAVAGGTVVVEDRDAPDPDHRYQCYTASGNSKVAALVAPFLADIRAEAFPRRTLNERYEALLTEISRTVPEVYDTEPRGQIAHEVTEACHAVGWLGLFETER